MSGVVEGFYGRPWTMEQRKELFKREKMWGLNAYLYAPKDDYKHRNYWRDLYTSQEAVELQKLIESAKKHDVDFIYAISPGLDITFSDVKEVDSLKKKVDQVRDLGCQSFALLFDDVEPEMCPADKQAFISFANAQVHISNEIYDYLEKPKTFLFCPTDYCGVFCKPNVSESTYLLTIGEKLHRGIDVLWTGPKVVSNEISIESIEEVTAVLSRPPVIWDNIHANDYDPQRVMLGPFKGRSDGLIPKLRGLLTNPNCEFQLNFVAIHTLATWCKSYNTTGVKVKDYSPEGALQLALSDWLTEFAVSDQACDTQETKPGETHATYVPGPTGKPLFTTEPLQLEDLQLLSDFFFLPYQHGSKAVTMIQELQWLKSNGHLVSMKDSEWKTRANQFDQMCESTVQMFNRLSNAANRRILYDLYNYICDIKSGVLMSRDFVKRMGSGTTTDLMVDDPEPWGFRGGLSGELQRMLPNHGRRDIYFQYNCSRAFVIKPYTPVFQSVVQQIFKDVCDPRHEGLSTKEPVPLAQRFACGQICPSSECAFLLEDQDGICGYAMGVTDAKYTISDEAYRGFLLRTGQAVITIQLLPRVLDLNIAKHLGDCVVFALRAQGSVHFLCELREQDKRMFDVLAKMGFAREPTGENCQKGLVIMVMSD